MTVDGATAEALILATIQRALENEWPDGKRRYRLQRVMVERVRRLRELTGCADLPGLRAKDRPRYERFLAGSVRALNRDGLIETGELTQTQLEAMKARFLQREHDARWPGFEDEDRRAGA